MSILLNDGRILDEKLNLEFQNSTINEHFLDSFDYTPSQEEIKLEFKEENLESAELSTELSTELSIKEILILEGNDLDNPDSSQANSPYTLKQEDEYKTLFTDEDFIISKEEQKQKRKIEKQKQLESLPFKLIKVKNKIFNSYKDLAQALEINPNPTKQEKQEIFKILKEYYEIKIHPDYRITLSYISEKTREANKKYHPEIGTGKPLRKKLTLKDYTKLSKAELEDIKKLGEDIIIEGEHFNFHKAGFYDRFTFIETYFLTIVYENYDSIHSYTGFTFKAFSRTKLIDAMKSHREIFYNIKDITEEQMDFLWETTLKYEKELEEFTKNQLEKLERHGFILLISQYVLEDGTYIDKADPRISSELKSIYSKYNLTSFESASKLSTKKYKELKDEMDLFTTTVINKKIISTRLSVVIREPRKKQIIEKSELFKDNRARQEALVIICEILRAKFILKLDEINLMCEFGKARGRFKQIPPKYKYIYDNYSNYKDFITQYIVYCNAENKEKGIESIGSHTLHELLLNRRGIFQKLREDNVDDETIERILQDFYDEDGDGGILFLNELTQTVKYQAIQKTYEEIENNQKILKEINKE